MGDVTSAAATRPAAASIATRSIRVTGRTAASSRRRASSREIVEVNGLIAIDVVADARVGLADTWVRPYRMACCTKCPSSGITSFSIASLTAASDPGSAITIRPATRPAHVRLIMAADPICW
jgi:hypothetical protein